MTEFSHPKSYRLLTKHDFVSLKSNSSIYKSKYFTIFYKPNVLNNSRIGLAIPKRVGCAVIRNSVKRHIREWFRHTKHSITNFDFLVIANKTLSDLIKSDCVQFQKMVFDNLNNFKEKLNENV